MWTISMLIGIFILGAFMEQVHLLFPVLQPAAYPYIDAFTTILSIAATILMAQKKLEAWLLWILVDIVSIALYAVKGITFISAEYVVFLGMASYGFYNWLKLYKDEKRSAARQVHAHS